MNGIINAIEIKSLVHKDDLRVLCDKMHTVKPIKTTRQYEGYDYQMYVYTCACDYSVLQSQFEYDIDCMSPYCPNCGSKLDWSEE